MITLNEVYNVTKITNREKRLARRKSRRKRANIIVRQIAQSEQSIAVK